MKIINIYKILLVATLFGASGCVELDTIPYDRETDLTYWEDPSSALSALNTCYTSITSIEELMYSEATTDNAYSKVPNEFTQKIGNGSYSTADPYVKLVWDSRYTGIRQCCELLGNIDKVPQLSAELKARYIGEAKVIRAYLYYDLYTKFGDVPYFTNVISIKESQTLPRTPRAQVVENIIQELKSVIDGNMLPASYSGDERGRITKWAAKSVLARVYLFEGRFTEVKNISDDIIKNGGFTLFGSYAGLFETENEYNSEVIFDVQYIPSSREHNINYHFLPPSLGGYSQLSPLKTLVDSYIMTNGKAIDEVGSNYDPSNPYINRDPRLAATIIYTGNSYTKADGSIATINCDKGADKDGYGFGSDCSATGYYIKKYYDKNYRAAFKSGLNPILIRYAEVLLMYAEAMAELGSLDQTAWDITVGALRTRAGFVNSAALDFPASATKAELISIVRNERRCELALEGQRQKDIVRWKIAETVMKGWCHGLYTGDVVGADNGFVRVEQRIFDKAKHYLWPIPQAERDLNKNLTQNPEW